MSLRRRNIIAFILILLAAVCWTFGQQMLDPHPEDDLAEMTTEVTVYSSTNAAMHPVEDVTIPASTTPAPPGSSGSDRNDNSPFPQMFGMILSFVAVIAGIIAIFALSQKNPILGPDGICWALALLATAYHISVNMDYIIWSYIFQRLTRLSEIVCAFVVLVSIREFWGWIRVRFPLS